MRAVVQRVARASVTVDGEVVGAIARGFMVLLGVTHTDGEEQAQWLASKIAGLRVFEDDDGKMNRSMPTAARAAVPVSPAPHIPRPPSPCANALLSCYARQASPRSRAACLARA
jgi:hypothetical protein